MKILSVDFDGTIHGYQSGWQGPGTCNDPPVPGAMQFLEDACKHFEVHVFSSRSSSASGRMAMMDYISHHAREQLGKERGKALFDAVFFPKDKPAAFLTLDDRAVTFNGVWPDPENLAKFVPWHQRTMEAV